MGGGKGFWLKIIVHAGGLGPLVTLIWVYCQEQLGADPIGEMILRTGRYALTFLILTLTPPVVVALGGFRGVLRIRRALGLYAFMYAVLHFLIFVGLDYGFDFGLVWRVTLEGPFLLVGLAAFIILTLLAMTSTAGWRRRLGENWKRLHRLVYLAGGLAVVHYVSRFKELRRMPLLIGAVLLLLLVLRIPPIARALAR